MNDKSEKLTGQPPTVGQKPAICSVSSRNASEQLFGTASLTQTWLLLEYPHPPGNKAFEESQMPPLVKEALSGLLKGLPAARLLLIRQRSAFASGGPALFVGIAAESGPSLYEFHLPDYEALLSIDLDGLVHGRRDYPEQRRGESLFLACTNGRRDACCARWGQPVYEALAGVAGGSAWQSSHVGGHRFAANVLCFPHGILLGRVAKGEVENVVSAYRRGQLVLANYRGRACYRPEAQAGEFFLRSQTGASQVEAYHLVSTQEIRPGTLELQFTAPADGKSYRLELLREVSDYQIYESCDSAGPSTQTVYRLQQFEEIS